ncbi:hypothetical protein COW36_13865 [bacterium (Candidatus Blackallbacteria) CG17_big_fil_post_rev_8_21_14_2_50_48_46]|uniref:Flagellar hook protein FlgE/F/G-like D1 domain-containing protein n=1 Tax=bacterium (Candidatus Blackallbacteria) CG17_big_fil_post_rev_8_21_14_2_50_48_46 TaxID=2014261 RepID=A0A2M7G370_9BACT|nr:MAG: hypothetical protein COW64_23340 [bacterium (Candidatus Blackallbacteria) CG18_big_fil_WC_8_21_14_2_50_49_26]PIW16213.1 MAG: hypothetical protein COW36_13865 [bacterium (Candidatus Blackallbacteria) CG17_big_fil_post_rev_8_21_14_2_50_48_46]PIW49904.1 MAG: hypothetical protein COW20_04440 [bacterium (Candidatus Blackallbacteria) CG13_big_fil_rev_8_21_14_2_50_49_14]
MSLSQVGVRSLLAVNSWIGLINSNLQGASRTGFKTVRPILSDGLGQLTAVRGVESPPSTLNVQATSLEWGQGAIVNSEQSSHFALQGEGFFVVADQFGRYYLTRDGEFHWDGNGYLTNSAGLKVISSGQDFIRLAKQDRSDLFQPDGASQELLRYGDKSLLIVDVANRDGLQMSQYGSTVFSIDGQLPLRIRNDMTETTDGLTLLYDDPDQLPSVDAPGFVTIPPFPAGSNTDFSIDFGDNGFMNFRDYNPLAGGPFPSATPLDFNPATNTIQHILNAINTYGATVGGRVSAAFDPNTDQLIIRNEQNIGGGVVNTQIAFYGPNATPLRKFFQIGQNLATNPIDDADLDGNLESMMQSDKDIDNSAKRLALDLVAADVNASIQSLSQSPRFPATYFHDKANGFLQSDASVAGRGAMVIGESQETNQFDVILDMKASAGFLTFSFGQNDPHQLFSTGFRVVYDTSVGTLTLLENPKDANGTSIVLQTLALPPMASAGSPPTAADPLRRLVFSMSPEHILTVSMNGNTAVFDLSGAADDIGGYLTIRNTANVMQIYNLQADFHQPYNVSRTGDIVSMSQTNIANVEIVERWQERQRTRVVQSSLETSTASLTEYVPMLALAQKVFASISKVISTHNAMIDDLNSLLR